MSTSEVAGNTDPSRYRPVFAVIRGTVSWHPFTDTEYCSLKDKIIRTMDSNKKKFTY
jgi:hypothetical protein